MRYLDIAVAALIGISAISGVLVWSPRLGDTTSRQLELQTQLRDQLLSYLQQRGILWILQSLPGAVCADLSHASNASITLSAVVGSYSCASPPSGATISTLPLQLTPYEVDLRAWSDAGG